MTALRGAACTLALALGTAHAQVLDLGTLGGARSDAFAIRRDGLVVVGSSLTASGLTQAFTWSAGTMSGLDFLTGGLTAEARGINLSGVIVGYSQDTLGQERAVLWSGLSPLDLGTLGGNNARAFAISDTGTVVGWAENALGQRQAFVYQSGALSALGLDTSLFQLEGSEAYGISANGRFVVGKALSASVLGETHAFVYDTVLGTTLDIVPSGNSIAWAATNTGVVGQFASGSDTFGFHYALGSGTSTQPPSLAGGAQLALGLSGNGLFVGTETYLGPGGVGTVQHAWYGTATQATDLNARFGPAQTLLTATGISHDSKFVVGSGQFGSETHAYITSIAPEGDGLPLLAAGLLPLFAPLTRRRRVATNRKDSH